MLDVFSLIFVTNAKIILRYDFIAPLIRNKDIGIEFIEFGKDTLHAETEQKLLGIIIDKDLNF